MKACIAKRTNQFDYPDKKLALDCYTHDIEALVRLAKLDGFRKIRAAGDRDFNDNWLIVKDWNEQARYQRWSEVAARELFGAVTDSRTGFLPWIKGHW